MYIISKDYLITVTINLGNLLGCEKDEDASITLRELKTRDALLLKEASSKSDVFALDEFRRILPTVILDHNIFGRNPDESTYKLSNDEVINTMFDKPNLTNYLIENYIHKSFFSSAPKIETK